MCILFDPDDYLHGNAVQYQNLTLDLSYSGSLA